jgi:uncharacterized membrane protein
MIQSPPTNDDRTRLLKSLAAAILIASVGFALIFLFFGSLPWFTLHWLSTLPPATATRVLSMMTIFARAFAVFTGVFTSLILALLTRRQRSKPRRPAQSI